MSEKKEVKMRKKDLVLNVQKVMTLMRDFNAILTVQFEKKIKTSCFSLC